MISGITLYMLIYTVIADFSWFFLTISSIHQQSHHHVSMFAGRTGGDLNHAGRSWRQLASATRPSEHPLNGRTAESWCQEDFGWRFINIPALVRVHYYDHLRALENWCWCIMGECSGQSSSFKSKDIERPLVAWFNCRRRAWGFIDTSESIAAVSLSHWGHSKLLWDPTSTTIL